MLLLEVKNFAKVYGKRTVVRNVSFKINPGEIVGLLGPNGAGKTTTFGMTIGMIRPNQGEVFFKGKNITAMPMYKRARAGIGYLSQEPSIFRNMTVYDNILAIVETSDIPRKKRKAKVLEHLKDLGLEHLARHKAGTLSGGERRRLEIARTLVNSPTLILLDEPFTGIDPIVVNDIHDIVKRLKEEFGIAVLLTDHNVREALSIVDRAYLVKDGIIFKSGTPQEIVEDESSREFYLGDRFKMDFDESH